jgi:thiopeptide-type bacteriocin biosynthesis protein
MNWISIHIFHNHSFEDVLVKCIDPLSKTLKKDGLIESSFFIRYWEGGRHIRYRLSPKKNTSTAHLKQTISSHLEDFFKSADENTEYKIEFSPYRQELERYGGELGIRISEKQFEDSSAIVLKLLKDHYSDWTYSKAISLAIQMHVAFAKEVVGDLDKAICFFESIYINWLPFSVKTVEGEPIKKSEIDKVRSLFNSSYEKQKELINFMISGIWYGNDSQEWIKDWANCCAEINSELDNAVNTDSIEYETHLKLFENSKFEGEKETKYLISDSYLHMSNNRLGIYVRDEPFIAFLIMNGLKNLQI